MTQAFNLSQLANKVNTSGELDLATGVTGTLPVNEGGTGQTTYTNGELLIGNTTGNTLTKATLTAGSGISVTNGTGSITIAATGGGQFQTQLFTAPGTWTNPGSVTSVRVTVIAGGGSGSPNNSNTGGFGGLAVASNVPVSAPVSVTVGAGGNVGSAGGTSSFGSAVSATGGAAGIPTSPVAPGSGTVSVGTALKTGNYANFATTGFASVDFILGNTTRGAAPGSPAGLAYSSSSPFIAGARGSGSASVGSSSGGVGGAVLVEFVG